MAWKELDVQEVVSGAQGELFILMEGRRVPIAQGRKIEARIKKNKTNFPVLGKSIAGQPGATPLAASFALCRYCLRLYSRNHPGRVRVEDGPV